MILFFGTEEDGSFVPEIGSKYDQDVMYSGYLPNLADAFDVIMSRNFKYIILNIEMIVNDYHEISSIVKKIKDCTNSTIIAYAQGYNYKQDVIQALFKVGVIDFILSTTLTGKYEALEKALRGINRHEEIAQLMEISDQPEEAAPPLIVHTGIESYKTVGIMGCMSRIGTTTQAIQIVKYLSLHGKRAAYIEMNNNGYIDLLTRYYSDCDTDDILGKVTYMNVDMFYKQEKISDILRMDYDYFIYDFGTFSASAPTRISYLEKNINIIVGGTKPDEMQEMQKVLNDMYDKNIEYIFSFSDENEHTDILEVMQDKAPKTHFAIYSPDAFVYLTQGNKIYDSIFQIDVSLMEPPKKSKKHFWERSK